MRSDLALRGAEAQRLALVNEEQQALVRQLRSSPPLPSRTNWTRLVPPPVLTGQASSLPPY